MDDTGATCPEVPSPAPFRGDLALLAEVILGDGFLST